MALKEDLIELLKTGDDDDLRSLREKLLKIPEEERLLPNITEDRVNGKYMRCMIAQAGTLIVGDIHAKEDTWEVVHGEIHVREQGEQYKLLKAGDSGLGEPGTFRIGVTETDVLWVNTCDMPNWVKRGNEYKYLTTMTDWEMFLERWGLTEEEIQKQMDSRVVNQEILIYLKVQPSKVHGNGVFTQIKRHKGDWLGWAKHEGGICKLGRYINHSSVPNVEFVFDDDTVEVKTLRDILAGEELFVDYNRNGEQLGAVECLGQQ